jgi:hypothetical protein
MDIKGKKVKLSIWVRSCIKRAHSALWTNLDSCPGYRGTRTLPNHHLFILPRRARNHSRSVTHSIVCKTVHKWCTVYDVANRESFEALPRWYSELETYVSSSVVKILVGNKVDKVHFPLFHNAIFFLITVSFS